MKAPDERASRRTRRSFVPPRCGGRAWKVLSVSCQTACSVRAKDGRRSSSGSTAKVIRRCLRRQPLDVERNQLLSFDRWPRAAAVE